MLAHARDLLVAAARRLSGRGERPVNACAFPQTARPSPPPPAERPAYAAVLRRLMRPGSRMLLQTFDLDRPPDTGPPYRVAQEELARLYPGARLRAIGERAATPEGWAAVTYRLDLP